MVVIQADPGFDLPETEDVNERETLSGIDGYNDLLDTLVAETSNFDGQVVLVHGDTHFFKIDKPLLTPSPASKPSAAPACIGSRCAWTDTAAASSASSP